MPQDVGAGGYHWQSESHVSGWDQGKAAMSEEREVGFAALLDHLSADPGTPLRVVDLGAGDGKGAEVVLERYPLANAALVDFSDLMIAKGVARMAQFQDRYHYVRWDMNNGGWPAELSEPLDAVVSSAAIHHVSDERKAWLATAVAQRLKPGGMFANYDLFRDADAQFEAAEVHDRTCATIEDAIAHLAAAGFVDIHVTAQSPRPKHQGQLALLIGHKPVH
jgi:SAM-dependent methyltransferase